MPRVRSKRWCVTLNNYTEEEELVLQSNLAQGVFSYLIYGREVGSQGTPHLQMYLETSGKMSLSSMKKIDGLSRAHLEKANGSLEQNQAYCRKEDANPFVGGSAMKQGKRSDLVAIQDLLDGGATCDEIADSHFKKWVVYRRSFTAYAARLIPDRHWKTHVTVLWGLTGTGKTRFVHDQIMDSTFYQPGDYQWFDGYTGQDIVLFDDFRGEYPLPLLLRLLDRYPLSLPIKGGFTKWCPKKIYITSNQKPMFWYPDHDIASINALKRRIDYIEEINEDLYQ